MSSTPNSPKTTRLCLYVATGAVDDAGRRQYLCPVCRHARSSKYPPEKLTRACTGRPDQTPTQRLVAALNELAANGAASRAASEIGRLLALCQKCEHFDADACRADPGPCHESRRRSLIIRLTRDCLWCPHDGWGERDGGEAEG